MNKGNVNQKIQTDIDKSSSFQKKKHKFGIHAMRILFECFHLWYHHYYIGMQLPEIEKYISLEK